MPTYLTDRLIDSVPIQVSNSGPSSNLMLDSTRDELAAIDSRRSHGLVRPSPDLAQAKERQSDSRCYSWLVSCRDGHGMSPTRLGLEQSDGDWGGNAPAVSALLPVWSSMPAKDLSVFLQAKYRHYF